MRKSRDGGHAGAVKRVGVGVGVWVCVWVRVRVGACVRGRGRTSPFNLVEKRVCPNPSPILQPTLRVFVEQQPQQMAGFPTQVLRYIMECIMY